MLVLLAELAPIQVFCGQIVVNGVTALTTSTANVTQSYDNVSLADGTTRNASEPVEETTIEIIQQTTTEKCQQNTTVTLKPTPALIDTGSLSKEVYDDFKVSSVYLQFVFVVLGILSNICNITVFTHKRMRSATSTILTFLSCSELGAAVSELIMTACTAALGRRTYISDIFWTLFQWIRVYLTVAFQRSSFCFNIIVATERFIAVRFPLKAKQILNRRNPVVFCAVTFVIVLGIHSYNPLKMSVVEIDTRHGTIYTIRNSQMYINNSGAFEVLSLLTKILFSYLPLFGCLLMNILMVMALWSHRKQRKLMQTNQLSQQQNEKRQSQMTITILMSTFLFVLLSLPVTTSTIAQTIIPEYGAQKQEHYLFRFITLLGGLLYLLSLSLDFLVYMILSRAFRQTFVSLYGSPVRFAFRCRDETMAARIAITGTRSPGQFSDSSNKAGGDVTISTVCKSEGAGFGGTPASMKYEVNESSRAAPTSDAENQTKIETHF